MGYNKSELGVNNDLTNQLGKIKRDLNELKTYPQKIGNGSMDMAVFGSSPLIAAWSLGPATVPAGITASFEVTYMDIGSSFTYNSLPAINMATLLDHFLSVFVDTNDANHLYPSGALLSGAQLNVQISTWNDWYSSGISSTNGQRVVVMQITNKDSSPHTYYLSGNALIPRPALKPQ
jgi:hypothetical protein